MFNTGSIFFGANTTRPVTPGTPIGAENGLSVDVAEKVVLGQSVGASGDPALVLDTREVPMSVFGIINFKDNSSFPSNFFVLIPRNLQSGSSGGSSSERSPIFTGSLYSPSAGSGKLNGIVVFDQYGATGGSSVYIGYRMRTSVDTPGNSNGSVIAFLFDSIINQTGSSSDTIRGVYVNPTLLSLMGVLIAYENVVGNNYLGSSNGVTVVGGNTVSGTAKLQVIGNEYINGRLGIGTNAPGQLLNVVGSGTLVNINTSGVNTVPAALQGGSLATAYIVHAGGNFGLCVVRAQAATGAANIVLAHTRNADASVNTPLLVADLIGSISFQGVGGTNLYNNACVLQCDVEAVTATVNCGRFRFQTTNSAGTLASRVVITCEGLMGIGTGLTPTALLTLGAGGAGVNGAPFKYTAGILAQTVVENGAKNFDGTNESLAVGGVTFIMAKTLTAIGVLDFPNTAAGTSSDLTIALTGAVDGDPIVLGVPNAATVVNGCFTGWVSAANTVTVRFTNNSLLAALDPASGTFRVTVIKY